MINRADIIAADDYLNDLLRDIKELKAAQEVGASTLQIVINKTADQYDYTASVGAGQYIMGGIQVEFEKQDNPYAELVTEIYMNGVRRFVGDTAYIKDPTTKQPIYPQSVGTPRNYKLLGFSFGMINNTNATQTFQLKFVIPATDKIKSIYPQLFVGTRNY